MSCIYFSVSKSNILLDKSHAKAVGQKPDPKVKQIAGFVGFEKWEDQSCSHYP